MKPLNISFISSDEGFTPLLQPQAWDGSGIQIKLPVDCRSINGGSTELQYARVEDADDGSNNCSQVWSVDSHDFSLQDLWQVVGEDKVRLERRVRVESSGEAGQASDGFQLHVALQLPLQGEGWQFFAPAMLYTPDQKADQTLVTFNDDRLAYPLIMAYLAATKQAVCLSRVSVAAFDNKPLRSSGEQRYMQRTDIGSTGFSRAESTTELHAYWPYYEGEQSALLAARGSDACAFYPLDETPLDLHFQYEFYVYEAESFADAVLAAYKNAYSLSNPQPPHLPFTLEDAIGYRLGSLQKTYAEWGDAGAGFVLNFDPEHGYDSQAKAFGASFTTHDTNESHSILEYGFTGRQLNASYMLADREGSAWLERGKRVSDFFVDQLTTPSGWLHTLYHMGKERPLYTVGDLDGPVMHYLALSPEPGNYTRMMVEAASDLLLNYRLHRQQGNTHEEWLAVCVRFGDFLLEHQGADGSWYRVYTPTGDPLAQNEWFGATEGEGKSATGIPVPYLLKLAEELDDAKKVAFIAAARKACDYVLREHVALDEYRGGTLDNPNVVDKEAAMLAMTALLHFYEKTGEDVYLAGAERAGKLAVTWNSIWNVPLIPGTRVGNAAVQSTGWGAINSTWGAGVTDIYSLFYLAEFERLSRYTRESIYADVAELIAYGTQQILSYPGDLMGFADTGMQPEGISFCNQGVDDGQIAKGDIWGGLGWIYTAGTYGLARYLSEREVISAKQ